MNLLLGVFGLPDSLTAHSFVPPLRFAIIPQLRFYLLPLLLLSRPAKKSPHLMFSLAGGD